MTEPVVRFCFPERGNKVIILLIGFLILCAVGIDVYKRQSEHFAESVAISGRESPSRIRRIGRYQLLGSLCPFSVYIDNAFVVS